MYLESEKSALAPTVETIPDNGLKIQNTTNILIDYMDTLFQLQNSMRGRVITIFRHIKMGNPQIDIKGDENILRHKFEFNTNNISVTLAEYVQQMQGANMNMQQIKKSNMIVQPFLNSDGMYVKKMIHYLSSAVQIMNNQDGISTPAIFTKSLDELSNSETSLMNIEVEALSTTLQEYILSLNKMDLIPSFQKQILLNTLSWIQSFHIAFPDISTKVFNAQERINIISEQFINTKSEIIRTKDSFDQALKEFNRQSALLNVNSKSYQQWLKFNCARINEYGNSRNDYKLTTWQMQIINDVLPWEIQINDIMLRLFAYLQVVACNLICESMNQGLANLGKDLPIIATESEIIQNRTKDFGLEINDFVKESSMVNETLVAIIEKTQVKNDNMDDLTSLKSDITKLFEMTQNEYKSVINNPGEDPTFVADRKEALYNLSTLELEYESILQAPTKGLLSDFIIQLSKFVKNNHGY